MLKYGLYKLRLKKPLRHKYFFLEIFISNLKKIQHNDYIQQHYDISDLINCKLFRDSLLLH
jgi:hypothetical protein